MDECRACHATIRFVPTLASEGEKSMPIDVEPVDDGNVRLIWSNERHEYEADVIPTAELRQLSLGDPPFSTQAGSLVDTRYMSHFVTCPNADRFR